MFVRSMLPVTLITRERRLFLIVLVIAASIESLHFAFFKAPSMIDFALEVFNWRQQWFYVSYFLMLYLFPLQHYISAFESTIYKQCCALKISSKGQKCVVLHIWSCYSIFFFVKCHLWTYQEFYAVCNLSTSYHFLISSA